MARMDLKAGLVNGNLECIVEIREAGKPLGHVLLDASSLEGWIRDLAVLRASMFEQVAPELGPNSRVEGTFGPAWRIPEDPEKMYVCFCYGILGLAG